MSHTHRHTHPTTYHTHTTPQSLTCVDQLYEACSLPRSVVNIPHFSSRAKHFLSVIWIVFFSDTPLEKTEFPSPTAANCKQASWLGVGLLFSADFVWLETVQVLCLLSKLLWVSVSISLHEYGRHCLLGVIYHLRPSKSFCLTIPYRSWALREEFDKTSHLALSALKISHSLHMV